MTTPTPKPQKEIERAIRDHRAWKTRLRISIETKGKYDQPVQDVRRNDLCPLGLWLDSLDEATRSGPHWQRIHSVHSDFHAAAASILELAIAEKKDEAERALEPGGDFENLSRELVAALDAWRIERESEAA